MATRALPSGPIIAPIAGRIFAESACAREQPAQPSEVTCTDKLLEIPASRRGLWEGLRDPDPSWLRRRTSSLVFCHVETWSPGLRTPSREGAAPGRGPGFQSRGPKAGIEPGRAKQTDPPPRFRLSGRSKFPCGSERLAAAGFASASEGRPARFTGVSESRPLDLSSGHLRLFSCSLF